MSKKVFISAGHGGSDPGAIGNGFNEKDLNLAIALACGNYLKSRGINVRFSRTTDENDALAQEVAESNAFNPDVAVSIHNNAGGGDGVETWYSIYGGLSKSCAESIIAEVVKIGQNSRGAKYKKGANGKDYYGFIRQTKAPAVIVECAFMDNSTDIQIIDTHPEQVAMGEAIAKGILTSLGVANSSPAPAPAPSFKSYRVKVTASALNIRNGAGTNYSITGVIRDKGVYTIINEKSGWGQLKSGAGWISLGYCKKI